ncbi:MAG: hypothetical protein IJB27_06890 [Clostridia bacterium]|nr:hypothetical protein [Clostridia bacterium]
MKQRWKIGALVLMLCAMLTLTVACADGEPTEPSPLWGTWGDGTFEITFTEDGTCLHNGEYWSDYTVEGDCLTLISDGEAMPTTFTIDGDNMTLTRDNGNTLTMRRIR